MSHRVALVAASGVVDLSFAALHSEHSLHFALFTQKFKYMQFRIQVQCIQCHLQQCDGWKEPKPTTNTRLTASFPWQPGWAGARKEVKSLGISLRQDTMWFYGGNSRSKWKQPAPHSRQIAMPAPHNPVFLTTSLHDAQPEVSELWRQLIYRYINCTMKRGRVRKWLNSATATFHDPRSILPGPCHKPETFKYRH